MWVLPTAAASSGRLKGAMQVMGSTCQLVLNITIGALSKPQRYESMTGMCARLALKRAQALKFSMPNDVCTVGMLQIFLECVQELHWSDSRACMCVGW
mmetsp:Transcript_9451/g.28748  ORF Transcript_9451/g.28748 Transcript_9451/m.28748 type:complete len:98 (-) Transcript_9451:192-485(-)